MKIVLVQINPTVGALSQNRKKLHRAYQEALKMGAELIVSSELALTGYPPCDLLLDQNFLKAVTRELKKLARNTQAIPFLVGAPFLMKNQKQARSENLLWGNAACLLRKMKIEKVFFKSRLPNYDVFDEKRYFQAGESKENIFQLRGKKFGVTICEDIWDVKEKKIPLDSIHPIASLKGRIDCLINLAASPYERLKQKKRFVHLKQAAKTLGVPLLYVNQWGGQDEIVFAGNSLWLNASGMILKQAKHFEDDLLSVDLFEKEPFNPPKSTCAIWETCEKALIIGLRDYVQKCGFSKVLLGISGGIDSALVAYLAVRALGCKNVLGIALPSKYSSKESIKDARALAKNLGIELKVVPIKKGIQAIRQSLQSTLGEKLGTSEENAQARLRGLYLMAISNSQGRLLLATGNKSEVAVGYCTLYGDMNGALNPIGDLYKTEVYKLCDWINRKEEMIPLFYSP